jgi:arginine utilization protein RocB
MLSCREDVLFFTEQLVQIESVVNTEGEKAIADALYAMMSAWPYFQKFPNRIFKEKTVNDHKDRYNILACVQGTKAPSDQTIILMGHLDTVDIEDYGRLRSYACSPEKLSEALRFENMPEAVHAHLKSDEWLFGRGALDMKSGVANHMYLMKYYSEHPEEIMGNLVFLAVCDEEDSSHGMLSALNTLNAWKVEHHFDYIAAINAEFVSPRYEGDPNRYVYKGTVGKLLPTFYITGQESHVGSCFDGLDPNFITAELTKQISYNPALCDELYGEMTMPPVSLKQSDLKPFYTVQTTLGAFVYYNFFVHSWSPAEVLSLLRKQAEISLKHVVFSFKERYQTYCKMIGEASREITWKPEVWTFRELNSELAGQHGDRYVRHMEHYKEKLMHNEDLDMRMFSVRVVEEAWKWRNTNQPAIVLFYSSLYSPASTLTGATERERKLSEALDQAIERVQPYYSNPIKTSAFFPYISDMSFLKIKDDEAAISAACENNPSWGSKHWIDYNSIRELNIPVINIGPYGMDAHKKYERTELKYTTEIVPNLTHQVIEKLIGCGSGKESVDRATP